MDFPKDGRCSLCGGWYTQWGNNPEPLRRVNERCCRDCNWRLVIPTRLKLLKIEAHKLLHEIRPTAQIIPFEKAKGKK
jgi:hypothetical protein